MKLLNIAAVAVTMFILSGCAQTIWDKAGATQQDFARDSYECERDMRQGGHYGGGLLGAMNAQDFQGRCMVARGWTARTK
jgi:hypothetical protein